MHCSSQEHISVIVDVLFLDYFAFIAQIEYK